MASTTIEAGGWRCEAHAQRLDTLAERVTALERVWRRATVAVAFAAGIGATLAPDLRSLLGALARMVLP